MGESAHLTYGSAILSVFTTLRPPSLSSKYCLTPSTRSAKS